MKPLRVLIVEDEALIGLVLTEMLADMGHKVCATAATQADASAAAVRHRPDLMIVDVTLSEGSGLAAVEDVLRTGPVPYVFITGSPGAARGTRPGAVVVGKPFRQADLAKAIEKALAA
jgi:CheY-like chemotaxis protein